MYPVTLDEEAILTETMRLNLGRQPTLDEIMSDCEHWARYSPSYRMKDMQRYLRAAQRSAKRKA